MQQPIASGRYRPTHAALSPGAFVKKKEGFGEIIKPKHKCARRQCPKDQTGQLDYHARSVGDLQHKFLGSWCGKSTTIRQPSQPARSNHTGILSWADDFQGAKVLTEP